MCTPRSLSTIAAVLTLGLAAPVWAQQGGAGSTSAANPAPVVSVDDAPHLQPQKPQVVGTSDALSAPGERHRAELGQRVAAGLADARTKSVELQSALHKVQDQFAALKPGQMVSVPVSRLQRYQRAAAALQAQFAGVQRGLSELQQPGQARRVGQVVDSLDELQQRLALLGLQIQKQGGRDREPNALELNLNLLEASLEALPRVVPAEVEAGAQPSIIRPPQDVEAPSAFIRPPQDVQPPSSIIRPPTSTEQPQPIIRPPTGVAPQQQVIRPPTSQNPATQQ